MHSSIQYQIPVKIPPATRTIRNAKIFHVIISSNVLTNATTTNVHTNVRKSLTLPWKIVLAEKIATTIAHVPSSTVTFWIGFLILNFSSLFCHNLLNIRFILTLLSRMIQSISLYSTAALKDQRNPSFRILMVNFEFRLFKTL